MPSEIIISSQYNQGDGKLLEKIKCNLCGSAENNVLVQAAISPFGIISNLVKCEQCGLVYFDPRLSLNEELEFYRSKYQEAYGEEFWYKSRIDFFETALGKIEALCLNKGSLLDVGCGMGFFLEAARDRGWEQVLGVEVSNLAVDHANQKLGLEVLEGDLRDLNLPEDHFDVATAWNVIDQLQDPVDTLKEMHRVLKEDGLLALRVSNLNFHLPLHRLFSLLGKLFGKRIGFTTRSCFHIYAFSPSSIRMALQRTGYVNVKIYNSPIEGGAIAHSWIERAVRQLIFSLTQGIFYLTGGTLVFSPSLLVFARKPGGP